MTPDEAHKAVHTGQTVVARYADGTVRYRGPIFGYTIVPAVLFEVDGKRDAWRVDMCEIANEAGA